jgi:hypothetical protein
MMKQKSGTSKVTAEETRENLDHNPYVFIVGSARSGTTLLHRIVDEHPEIAITPEMHWISRHFKTRNGLVTPELVSELTEHKRFAQFEIPREDVLGHYPRSPRRGWRGPHPGSGERPDSRTRKP